MCRFGEVGFQPRDFASLVVYPHHAGEFLDKPVDCFFRLVVWVSREIESDHIGTVKAGPARIREEFRAKEIGNLRLVLLLFFRLFLGIGGQLCLFFLQLVEAFVEALVFAFPLIGIERLTVFAEETADLVVADVENVVVLRRAGSYPAVRVGFLLLLPKVAGVELADFLDRVLILGDVAEQRGNVGQWALIRWSGGEST